MTEEEQRQEVAVWGENMNLMKDENNKMLKEILSFVRKVDSAEYRDHQDFMEFLRNVAADIWVEYTEPEQRSKLFNLINKEK